MDLFLCGNFEAQNWDGVCFLFSLFLCQNQALGMDAVGIWTASVLACLLYYIYRTLDNTPSLNSIIFFSDLSTPLFILISNLQLTAHGPRLTEA